MSPSDAPPDLTAIKQQMRAAWMTGDYGIIARYIETHAIGFVARRGLAPGTRVLDVACGTGNVAIAAARAGARVTAIDIAANLLQRGRQRAQRENLPIRFDEGDAEAMPYADESFDMVLSMYGAMFAPRPERAAAELIRVCRRDGQIVMANWTAGGFIAQMLDISARYAPPQPGVSSPLLWGNEAIVRERLRDNVTDLRLTKVAVVIESPFSAAETAAFFANYFGPILQAVVSLSTEKQAVLFSDLRSLWEQYNRATDGSTLVPAEYLEVSAVRV